MARLRTTSDLNDATDQDLVWRLREISDLRSAAERADTKLCDAIVRGGITLLYAHWEGHVRFVATSYLEFLATQRLKYQDLKPAFLLGRFHRDLLRRPVAASYAGRLAFLSQVLGAGRERFSAPDPELVSTRSNLGGAVLTDICCALAIDAAQFAPDMEFIDRILRGRRNDIAHGGRVSVDLPGFRTMSDKVIELMRRFNNAVQNDAALRAYRVSS
jgi:MAE_28990/MAE_18760-like HEPN